MLSHIPIGIVVPPSLVTGGYIFLVTIQMSGPVPADTPIEIDTSNRQLICQHGGGTLPQAAPVPAGQSSLTVNLDAATVNHLTEVQILVGDGGADLTTCATWRAMGTIRLTP